MTGCQLLYQIIQFFNLNINNNKYNTPIKNDPDIYGH